MRDFAADGRDAELKRLMRVYGTPFLRLATVYLKDASLAEDAVQETFLKAYRGLKGFRGESEMQTWLTRILINTCKNALRTAWARRIDGSVSIENLPERGAPDAVCDTSLTEEIVRLPPRLREAVLLRYYRDMRIEEIAKALGVSQSAVKQRIRLANAKLRERLEGWYFDA